MLGSDILLSEKFDLILNKRLTLLVNHTSLLSDGTHLLDTLLKINQVKVLNVLSPEHGFEGNFSAGTKVTDTTNKDSSLHFFSLYGKTLKPTDEMLNGSDLILIDLQDVGSRFYTYISTMFYVLQAAAGMNIPLIVLDRPNPYSGNIVDGPVLKNSFQSFIGIAPLPIIHGMTIGEIADYFCGEVLPGKNLRPDIQIIKMQNWSRDLFYDDLDLKWIKPSPNISDFETILVYPSTCLLEGTNISEGRGTQKPFLQIGAPFINPEDLINELKKFDLSGIEILSTQFIPQDLHGVAESPKYEGKTCNGITISITDKLKFKAVKFGIQLISSLIKLYGDKINFREEHFDRLIGNSTVRESLMKQIPADDIYNSFTDELENFKQIRKKYLLY
ncbi:MAG: DUF1343 domain-containing protein [Ignavibacteriales bacterium]|nr:MAG: DUF1343 domain-containing protein [Ignavibacteriales bacterium]